MVKYLVVTINPPQSEQFGDNCYGGGAGQCWEPVRTVLFELTPEPTYRSSWCRKHWVQDVASSLRSVGALHGYMATDK